MEIIAAEENVYLDQIFLKCKTEHGLRFINADCVEGFAAEKPEEKKKASETNTTKAQKRTDEQPTGENSRKVRIVCYCSKCNGGGGTQTASGKKPVAHKTCAFNGVPFGTVIHTSYGDFTVIDRCGSKNCLDVWIGECPKCRCSRAGYYGTEIVTWN